MSNSEDSEFREEAVYQFQTIKVDDELYNLFFDNGCRTFVSRYQGVSSIGSRAVQTKPGPLVIRGVGGIVVVAEHGEYNVKLPLAAGGDATFSGMCMSQITETFPNYPIQGEVENDIHTAYREANGDPSTLPKLPKFVGGDIDFMIGIRYNRRQPKLIFELPSGLAIYRSVFENADGGVRVVGGLHQRFSIIESNFNHNHRAVTSFLCQQR